jgi:hypothetical protein
MSVLFKILTFCTLFCLPFSNIRLLGANGMLPQKSWTPKAEAPKTSIAAIEKRIVLIFKDQKWFEGANFPWTNEFGKIGKAPEAKKVVDMAKKAFRLAAPEALTKDLKTPRQLADFLLDALNNGIYFYEKPDFQGAAYTVYVGKGQVTDVQVETKYLKGACIKPKGYEAKIEFGDNLFFKLGKDTAAWENAKAGEKIPAQVFSKPSAKMRLFRE